MSKLTFAVSLVLLCTAACAGHHEKSDIPEAAMGVDEAALMQAMAAAGELGDAHAALAKGVGQFDASIQFWMGPGAEPMVSQMSVKRELELGGRVLVDRWQGSIMGAPFSGLGRTGYDNVSERYWTTWTDNMSTGVLVMYGTWDDDQEAVVFTGTSVNPATGESYKVRSLMPLPDGGTETMAMYEDHGHGEYKAMQFTLTPR